MNKLQLIGTVVGYSNFHGLFVKCLGETFVLSSAPFLTSGKNVTFEVINYSQKKAVLVEVTQ